MAAVQNFPFLGYDQTSLQDLAMVKTFPGLEYIGEEDASIYFEDREVDGVMWRVENATFNQFSLVWLLINPALPAYAMTMDADGNTSFYIAPAGVQPVVWTNTWSITAAGVGSFSIDANSLPHNANLSALGVFNAGFYGMAPGNSGTANTTALQLAINAAVAAGGGTVMIPGDDPNAGYQLNGGVTITSANPISIVGQPERTILVQNNPAADTFSFTSCVTTVIQDLTIKYSPTANPTTSGVKWNLCQDFHMFRVQSYQAGFGVDILASSGFMLECIGNSPGVANSRGVRIDGNGPGSAGQVYMDGCRYTGGGGGFSIGLHMIQASGCVVNNCTLSGYQANLALAPAVSGSDCTNNTFFNVIMTNQNLYSCLIQPVAASGAMIQNINFSDCQFNGFQTGSGQGVLVDTNGASNANVDTINFNECSAFSNAGAGIEITSGRHIHISGGNYSSNALSAATQAGISIHGPVTDVTVNDSSCVGTVFGLGVQPYGMRISDGAANIFVSNVDLRNNGTGPIYFGGTAPGSNVQVTECPAYNDQYLALTGALPASPATINGVAPYGYYGPVDVYVHGGTVSDITTAASTGLTAGTFPLGPGQNLVITYSGAPTLLVIGK